MRDTGTTSQSATPRIPNRISPGLAQGRSASEPEVAVYRSRKPPERSHFRLAALGLESIRYVDTRPPSHMGMKATPADRATHSNCAWPSHRTARAARCSQRIHQRDDQRRRLSAVICSTGHLVIEAVASSADRRIWGFVEFVDEEPHSAHGTPRCMPHADWPPVTDPQRRLAHGYPRRTAALFATPQAMQRINNCDNVSHMNGEWWLVSVTTTTTN